MTEPSRLGPEQRQAALDAAATDSSTSSSSVVAWSVQGSPGRRDPRADVALFEGRDWAAGTSAGPAS